MIRSDFKCGSTDAEMYKDFMTGLDGSPMPSFADNVKPDEAWDLVIYLRTLQPDDTIEKRIAKQIGLKPLEPNGQLPGGDSCATGAEHSSVSADESAPLTNPSGSPLQANRAGNR